MLLGSIVYKTGYEVSDSIRQIVNQALIYQRPPLNIALAISEAHIAHACTDISDGLQAACRNMLSGSDFGIELYEAQIPIHGELRGLANDLSLTPLQLSMAGGDWQFLYSIPKNRLKVLDTLSKNSGAKISVIGEVIDANGIWARTLSGDRRKLRQIEHDSFVDRIDGKSYFNYLSDPLNLFE